MKKFFSWIGLAIEAALLVACNVLPAGEFGRLSITATSDGVARSLEPQMDLTVASYDFFGSGPNSAMFEFTDVADGTHSAGGLTPGEWTVTAIGKNADGTEIVEATVKAEVKVAETTEVSLLCEPSVGNGTLALQLSWPDALVASPSVQATLVSADDSEKPIPLKVEPSASGVRLASGSDAEVVNGPYTLSLELQDNASSDQKSVWGVIASVLILKGAVTTGSWTLDAAALASGGISIDIGPAGSSPFKVTFSGGEAELLQGYPQTVSASSSPEAQSWRWYLNGTHLSGQAGKAQNLTLSTSSLRGAYRLSALVRRGSDRGSGVFSFRVYPNDSDFTAFSGLLAGYACNGASIVESISSRGVFVLKSGPGADEGKSELVGSKTMPGYLGGKAFLGLPNANGKALTSNFRISFKRTIDSHPPTITDPSTCMYFNLIVEGAVVHNGNNGTGVLVAATPSAGSSVVLDGTSLINNISGGWIGVDEGHKIEKNKITIAGLASMNVRFVNAVTNDNGTPIGKKLPALLIIVGDSRKGNMSNVVMTVSDLTYNF
jgi:hypothetical protein